jgi:glutathione S-transferase
MSYAGGQQNSKNTGNLMKHSLLLATALLTLTGTGEAAQPKATPLPDITIYHLEGRRSERIVWLMEELGMPYKLEFKRGDLAGSMASIKAINPGMPVAPTVKYGDQVIVESGAIIEMILNRHAPGKLRSTARTIRIT